MENKVEITEYKGNPILVLPVGENNAKFQFGMSKAKAIVKYWDDIVKFVADNSETKK